MDLKLIVASMSALGLISCPVYAAIQKDAPICTISQNTVILDGMTQNYGRAIPNPCRPGWFSRIRMAGGVNVDVGHWGNRNQNYMGENYQRVSLNDSYINLSADVSKYVNAFASVSYMNATTLLNPDVYNNRGAAEYSAAYANNINGNAANTVQIEQAFATIANFDEFPFFLQFGKSFQDFDRYRIHPITRSIDQVMSEVLATSIKLGFVANGFHGAVYGFDTPVGEGNVDSDKGTGNFGAALGYSSVSDTVGWDLGIGYLYNLVGVNDIAYAIQNFNNATGYNTRVAAGNAYAGINYDTFYLGAGFTIALNNFNRLDLPSNGYASLTNSSVSVGSGAIVTTPTATPVGVAPIFVPGANGAKPWAFGMKAGYGFTGWDKEQHVHLGYQASMEASGLNLPRYRVLFGYDVDILKNNNWAVEWDHDIGYDTSQGGTGIATNLVSVRSTVKFG